MHWPDALHVDGPVYTSARHDSGAHTVVFAGYLRQAPAPSHFPSVPQLAAVMSTQMLCGSAEPAVVSVHRPVEQVRQAPVQTVLQHTPGPPATSATQCRFWQSSLAAQGCPSTFGPQLPLASHAMPSAQSALVVQRELQVPFAHRYFSQLLDSDGSHAPRPLQLLALFIDVAPEQVDAPQGVDAG
jgi:hypothetical protein